MAGRRAHYVRDARRSISSASDDEEPDEEQQSEEDRGGGGGVRLPTLRSMIVRVNSNDETDDRGDDDDDDDGGREAPPPLRRDEGEERNKRTLSHGNSRSEDNWRRGESEHNSGPAYGLAMSQRNVKGSEADEGRGNFRSRGGERDGESWRGRDRDGRHDLSQPADKDGIGGRGRGGLPGARFRDLDQDHRDRAVQQRDYHSRSPPRRQQHSRSPPLRDRRRNVDEGKDSLRRRDGKKRDIDRSPDEDEEQRGGRYDDADADKYENDVRGKAKDHREGFRRDRDGGGRGHPADYSSHRDRDVSPSSGDRRDTGGGSRSPLAVGRSNSGGRNGVGWGRGRERDDGRNGRDDWRGGRREADRGRDGGGREAAGETLVPELYSIHRATVHSIRPFGIFVRMDGYRNHGMVHLTQISKHEVTDRKDSDEEKVKAISSVVGEGEQVWVKVISVQHEEEGGKVKVGCSLKLVSQGDGKDLDPNNLQLEKQQSRAPWQGPKKLELDAVYNVSCTRCGGHGHLKKECYSTGERTYELLEDAETDEDDDAGGTKAASASVVSKKLMPAVGPSSKPPVGPAGRGRAMVQPAWMTHGVGVGGDQENVLGSHSSKGMSKLPEKVTSLEDALAVIEMAKEEKRKRRLERRLRKHGKGDKKHRSKEGRKEKSKKRHRNEDDHHLRSRKKRRL